MTTPLDGALASTPAATRAETEGQPDDAPETSAAAETETEPAAPPERAGPGEWFTTADTIGQRPPPSAHHPAADEPQYRPLRVYTLDPTATDRDGGIAVLNVPYEPLAGGPAGCLFEVDDEPGGVRREDGAEPDGVDLNVTKLLLEGGAAPSPGDSVFRRQMVYAVCSSVHATFRRALGRQLSWGFPPPTDGRREYRLRLLTRGREESNAFYDRGRGALVFGHFKAALRSAGNTPPRGPVFTALSHDVVAHELTHAVLDGLRPNFMVFTHPDVAAFHEAFGDLVALFQHFSYDRVVRAAIRRSRGVVAGASLLTDIARQFGYTRRNDGRRVPLRTAVDYFSDGVNVEGTTFEPRASQAGSPTSLRPAVLRYDPAAEPHALGSVLVAAVFEAFATVFARKTERYRLLATGGTGELGRGELPPPLQDLLAKEASDLAAQFLSICIRAIDYCPPVDLRFGEYLRALVTADRDLVRDDPWGYREALITAFRRRGVYPPQVDYLSEEALLWTTAPQARPVAELSFARLRFDGDPGRFVAQREHVRQARALGRALLKERDITTYGLARPEDLAASDRDALRPPCVESIRTIRRVGPDGQVVFDLVAEVTQRRQGRTTNGQTFDYYGGCTLLLDTFGGVRYVIAKSIRNNVRLDEQRAYVESEHGRKLWVPDESGRRLTPAVLALQLLHNAQDGIRGDVAAPPG